MRIKLLVGRVAAAASAWAGSTTAIVAMFASLIVYLIFGFYYDFCDEYQLIANTFMSAVSYALLFLIQNTQNRESKALHIKIDELILKQRRADNALLGIEDMTDEQIAALAARYKRIASQSSSLLLWIFILTLPSS